MPGFLSTIKREIHDDGRMPFYLRRDGLSGSRVVSSDELIGNVV
jgi:hypothetical protein